MKPLSALAESENHEQHADNSGGLGVWIANGCLLVGLILAPRGKEEHKAYWGKEAQ